MNVGVADLRTQMDPIVGNWYRHLDKGQLFTVVSVNERDNVIELQHFDGDLEEIELSNWSDMALELSDAPEDWTGPVDNIEHDDMGYSEADMSRDDWREPLEETPRRSTEAWEDTEPEDSRDDWAEGAMAEELSQQADLENTAAVAVAADEAGDEATEEELTP